MTNPREAAYLALLSSMREEQFLTDFLADWVRRENPDPRDAGLAYELASGTMRRQLTLDYYATLGSKHDKLKLGRKEKIILYLAIYQLYFLDRIPDYAVVDESVELAKKYADSHFAQFLNALLRNLIAAPQKPPSSYTTRYSYPQHLVDAFIQDYGKATAEQIMEAGNKAPVVLARKRPGFEYACIDPDAVKNLPEFYIQNETPGKLMHELSLGIAQRPKSILDLCASPGGKLLAAHDLFPEAKLYANEISENRIDRLKENCKKYDLNVTFSICPGEQYPTNTPFDLIILDVPCSNTGVLNKRAEARWQQREHEKIQLELLSHAFELLTPTGEIWYLTCSILKKENEGITHHFADRIRFEKTVLPNGYADGGYGCALTHFSTR